MITKFGRRFALALLGLALGGFMMAGQAIAAAPHIIATLDGVAIKGYDTVAYWTEGKAVKGNALFKHNWGGADWVFASPANRDLFAANPEKYAPEFGGFCGFGMSIGRPVQPDPTQFRIVENKLYLMSGEGALNRWLTDVKGTVDKAKTNFPTAKMN